MSHGHEHNHAAQTTATPQSAQGGGCCGSQSQSASQPVAQTQTAAPVQIGAPGALGISLTPKAIAQAKKFIEMQNTPNHALRVSVVGGGCSGFSYRLELDDQIGPNDKTAEYDGLKVVTDAKSVMFLVGTEVDYQEGLQGAGFTFKNPSAKSSCGCGSSFSA